MPVNWEFIGLELLGGSIMCFVACWMNNQVQKPFLGYRWHVCVVLLGIFLFIQSVVAFSMAA